MQTGNRSGKDLLQVLGSEKPAGSSEQMDEVFVCYKWLMEDVCSCGWMNFAKYILVSLGSPSGTLSCFISESLK